LGQFLFAVTDWAVLPLRSFLPRLSRIDLSSLLPALAILLLLSLVKSWVMTRQIDLSHVSYLFIFDTLSLIITLLTVMLIIQAVLSWIQPQSHVQYFLHQLSDPLLRPIRNFMPLIGGIDLSPLVALLILQVLSMVIHSYKF
jgi:YggT family protein